MSAPITKDLSGSGYEGDPPITQDLAGSSVPAAVAVTGTLTDGTDPVVFPDLIYSGITESWETPEWSSSGGPAGSGDGYFLYYDEAWSLDLVVSGSIAAQWTGGDGGSPFGLTFVAQGSSTGTPVITAMPAAPPQSADIAASGYEGDPPVTVDLGVSQYSTWTSPWATANSGIVVTLTADASIVITAAAAATPTPDTFDWNATTRVLTVAIGSPGGDVAGTMTAEEFVDGVNLEIPVLVGQPDPAALQSGSDGSGNITAGTYSVLRIQPPVTKDVS